MTDRLIEIKPGDFVLVSEILQVGISENDPRIISLVIKHPDPDGRTIVILYDTPDEAKAKLHSLVDKINECHQPIYRVTASTGEVHRCDCV
jgi:hypothetical protein